MGRGWNEFVAKVDDAVGLGPATLLLFLVATLVALGWYFWPRWVPRRWPRLRRPRLRWRWPWRWAWRWPWARRWPWRRRTKPARVDGAGPEPVPHDTEGLPDLPLEALLPLADRLAAP